MNESVQVASQTWHHQAIFFVEPEKVLMPPLPIKLGFIQQFVTVTDKEFSAFKYLQDLFAKLSGTKVKAGVFVELQIKKILKCK